MDGGGFGLSRNPFQRSPELDDACLPNAVAALLSELQSSLRSPRGVSVLVGGSRCGKSFVAGVFARHVATVAEVAVLEEPISSASAIARDLLSELDASSRDFSQDVDWIAALRANVELRSLESRTTVIVIDNAHRLSPQALEDLAAFFNAALPLRLHIFLVGRPRLLDRMNSGADTALQAHLLKICRLEPLRVRESVRYLGRRLSILGADVAKLFHDDAIEEIVQKSAGRLIDLEEVTAAALASAQDRGGSRVTADDVKAAALAAAAEEDEVMAARQQPFRFQLTDQDEAGSWNAGEEEDESVEWGADEDGGDDEWHTDADDDEDSEEGMRWSSGSSRNEDDDVDAPFVPLRRDRVPDAQRRFAGRAVLSIVACLGLIWAANQLPRPETDTPHGRDAQLFAEPLSTKPEQIMRLATTVAAADADAQVALWREHLVEIERIPPEPVQAVAAAKAAADPQPVIAVATAGKQVEPAVEASAKPAPQPAVTNEIAGPLQHQAPIAAAAPATTAVVAAAKPAPALSHPDEVVVAKAKPAAASHAASKASSREVYTVQLGAFRTRSNAEELAQELRGQTTRILREDGLYRVMSGSFASKRDAALHETSLRRAGYRTYVRTAVF